MTQRLDEEPLLTNFQCKQHPPCARTNVMNKSAVTGGRSIRYNISVRIYMYLLFFLNRIISVQVYVTVGGLSIFN